jgi:hypothetical protein
LAASSGAFAPAGTAAAPAGGGPADAASLDVEDSAAVNASNAAAPAAADINAAAPAAADINAAAPAAADINAAAPAAADINAAAPAAADINAAAPAATDLSAAAPGAHSPVLASELTATTIAADAGGGTSSEDAFPATAGVSEGSSSVRGRVVVYTSGADVLVDDEVELLQVPQFLR